MTDPVIVNNTRIYGNRLGFRIDGTDYWCDIASYELAPSDKDDNVLTFADAAAGATSQWNLKGKAIQSFDTASFWRKVWEQAGKEITYLLAPHGNETASETQPHFTGKVRVGRKPSISSEAGDTKGSTFEFDWPCTGEPEMKTTGV